MVNLLLLKINKGLKKSVKLDAEVGEIKEIDKVENELLTFRDAIAQGDG